MDQNNKFNNQGNNVEINNQAIPNNVNVQPANNQAIPNSVNMQPANNQPIPNNVNVQPVNNQTMTSINGQSNNNHEPNKKNTGLIIFIIIAICLIIGISVFLLTKGEKTNENQNDETPDVQEEAEIIPDVKKSQYWISSNSLETFDLYFLQLENFKQNKVYSPLSIKYTLGMLKEGSSSDSKAQILGVIGDYQAKKYTNSKNMSLANALFIKDTYKKSIKNSYINTLVSKYNAEVKTDAFKTPNNVNSWISDKTLGLINNMIDSVSEYELLLINALAIDMEWQQKFILYPDMGVGAEYEHERFSWRGDADVVPSKFKDINEEVSGMEIIASVNNYDIVKTLGEENIRKTVKAEFLKYLEENPSEEISDYVSDEYKTGLTDDEMMEKYLDRYIKEINSNYKAEDKTTDFLLYVDDNVKAFAKDLKEYNGTTLQYVSIMPTNEELDSYINKVTSNDLNNIITNLKGIKAENFKDGVVTKITGFVPKFKFDYELNLKEDLKKLGITDVFDENKANLKNITDNPLYISDAMHKATIELTQEGIKASAATAMGGFGAGGAFDYLFDVPVEEIDLTFDKPYMFIIRDKNSGEVWFMGTVYNPLLYSEDLTKIPGRYN